MTSNGGPAFPSGFQETNSGMTLRDYAAIKAMQAFLYNITVLSAHDYTDVAAKSYCMADAMLKEREK